MMTRLNFYVSGWTLSLDDKTLAGVNLACVAGAKRGGGGEKSAKAGKREGRVPFPLPPIPFPFSLPLHPLSPFDACYTG